LLEPSTLSNNPLIDFPKLRTWAVVGATNNRDKFGYKIYHDLKNAGYTVYPVHPKLTELDGDRCYPNLTALPEKPAVVNLVIPPAATAAVVDECIKLDIQNLWFQPGAEDAAAIEKAKAAGLTVVHDACIMIQKQQWT
jgi:Predicted CoA-binding protein